MRLGQILVSAGRITPAQLDEGLRAQVLYGGRLGTNLVELGHVDLDGLALALARQHAIPAALRKHFERCDLAVQGQLPAGLAAQWKVVPIGHLADVRSRIALASMDPLPPYAVSEVAAALRLRPAELIVAVAAELRIRYFLERCYGIARESRFLRIRRSTYREVPQPPPDMDDDVTPPPAEMPPFMAAPAPVPTPPAPPGSAETDHEPTRERGFGGASGRRTADTPSNPLGRRWTAPDGSPVVTVGGADGWRVEERGRTTPPPRADEGGVRPRAPTPAPPRAPQAEGEPEGDPFDFRFDLVLDDEAPPAKAPPPVTAPPLPAPTRPSSPALKLRASSQPPVAADDDDDDGGILDFEVSADTAQLLALGRSRRFVRTLSDTELDGEGDTNPPPFARAPSPSAAPASEPMAPGTLGRIPIRRVRANGEPAEPITLEEAARGIRRATSRERVGDLVARALVRFTDAEVAAVFVVREPVAIGWKGIVRGTEVALDEVAVELEEAGALAAAFHTDDVVAVEGDRGTPLDHRLWEALGAGVPDRAFAARVAIADQAVCVLYAHGACGTGTRHVVERLAEATTVAFARLLRAAQR